MFKFLIKQIYLKFLERNVLSSTLSSCFYVLHEIFGN